MLIKSLLLISLLFSLTSCTSVALLGAMSIHPLTIGLKKDRNFRYKQEGYGFDAMINNIPIIEFSSSNNCLALKNYYDKQSIRWRTLRPIEGKIEVEIKRKYINEYDIGEIDKRTLQLQYIRLPSTKSELEKVAQHPTLKYNGLVIISNKVINNSRASNDFPLHTLDNGEVLPEGNYILFMRLTGTKRWDQKAIYLEVQKNATHQKFL